MPKSFKDIMIKGYEEEKHGPPPVRKSVLRNQGAYIINSSLTVRVPICI